MTTPDFTNYNGAIDQPDDRDYRHEEVYEETGGDAPLPSRMILDIAPWLNQGDRGACTIFWSSMGYNETFAQRIRTGYTHPYNAWTAWDECLKRWASDATWWIFQGALQVLKDLKYIGAYVRIATTGNAEVEMMKKIISGGKGIATGVPRANWWEVVRTGEFQHTTANVWGHIFALLWYDDDHTFADGSKGGLWCPNSWGGIGGFWIKYTDVKILYSQYEFALTNELNQILKAKENRRTVNLQKALDAGIWNEKNPNDKASDLEIRTMVNRATKHSDTYKNRRGAIANTFEAKIIRGKDLLIWNQERAMDLATDGEIAIMFTRSVMRNKGLNELVLSRMQVAEVIWRDFL